MEEPSESAMGASGLVAEVFREGPRGACALGGSVFSMLLTSQGVHGAGVEGSGGCVITPGLQLQCIIYSFIYFSLILLLKHFPIKSRAQNWPD